MKLMLSGILLLISWIWYFIINDGYIQTSTNNYEKADVNYVNNVPSVKIVATTQQKLPTKTNQLALISEQTLLSASGTKSVIFNSDGSKLYAMNLEGLSICEFNQKTKSVLRTFTFKPTKGLGWDYQNSLPIISWQEKPVEASLSNNDSILWVSLHNANGIVPINIKDEFHQIQCSDSLLCKKLKLSNSIKQISNISVPLIYTGSTPKVIEVANKGKNLLVTNWHSKTISILDIHRNEKPGATVIKNISVAAIPRGILVDDSNQKSYIAIMGSNTIAVLNNISWQIDKYLPVLSNPRHVIEGANSSLIVSFNGINKIAIVNKENGRIIDSISTNAQPRSLTLSKDKQFLFVTCYNGNCVDVFKITNNKLNLLYSLPSKGKPVGIDLFEDDKIIEAWVCNYVTGNIKVFSFTKN